MSSSPSDIAIIGMSCIFPGAGDVDSFWKNICNKKDAITAVPSARIDPVFFDKNSFEVDRFYCSRGGFIEDSFTRFDPVKFGIVPISIDGTEPDQLMALQLSHRALEDAGVFEKKLPLDKAGIILGRGNYLGRGMANVADIVRSGEQLTRSLRKLFPGFSEAELTKIKKEYQRKKSRYGPDTTVGLIPNLAASMVANRLNFGGPAYTIDAACASSLIAVHQAITELNSGNCDLVIAGGIHLCHDVTFWSVFTQLGALSRSENIRPFHKNADGLLMGEGCGLIVIKRLSDALKDDHRIYAVIKGTGISSDGSGTSLMSPSVKGQAKAIEQAWAKAQIDVNKIGYIETHGTGTPVGDKTEAETLLQVFGNGNNKLKAGLGSVKSMIGHAMPAAGIAGLIKTALALYHKKLPPTLHCEDPIDILKKSKFSPVHETTDWLNLPLIAGVNAFGFGGINAHVVLQSQAEAPLPSTSRKKNFVFQSEKENFLLLARRTKEELVTALQNKETETGEGKYRIAIVDPSEERIQKAIKIIGMGKSWRNRNDFWYSENPLLSGKGKIAFLFPGLDGLSEGGSIDSLVDIFGFSKKEFSSDQNLRETALKIFETNKLLDKALKKLNIFPDAVAGHSFGEWTGWVSAGMVEEESILGITTHILDSKTAVSDRIFLALGCGFEKVKSIVNEIGHIYLSNDNCTNQVVLCGEKESIAKCKKILLEKDIFHQELSFRSGFHSPFAGEYIPELNFHLRKLKFRTPQIPVYSSTTLTTYPVAEEEIIKLQEQHILNPVRFRELTQKLFDEGFRVFIQIGAGGLTGFIDDTLKGKDFLAIAASIPQRPALDQVKRVLASLFVEGKENVSALPGKKKNHAETGSFQLKLSAPFVDDFTPVHIQDSNFIKDAEAVLNEPMLKAFNDNLKEIINSQNEVMKMFSESAKGNTAGKSSLPVQRKNFTEKISFSLGDYPELIDHSFYPQKPGWKIMEDIFPVVPLTLTLENFGKRAQSLLPRKKLIKFENIGVYQWIKVAEPFHSLVECQWIDDEAIHFKMENFADLDIVMRDDYSPVPGKEKWDLGSSIGEVSVDDIYGNYMFHGPAYQGIKSVIYLGENGIKGRISGSSGKGSLLDNAGQLFGLWLQHRVQHENISFPVKVSSIEFFGDWMAQEGDFDCTCVLRKTDDSFFTGDMIIEKSNKVWALIKGWQNRRLEHDKRLWQLSINRTKTLMASVVHPGIYFFDNAYKRPNSWEALSYCYLNTGERAYYNSLPINKKREWIISRIAVKDAVRDLVNKTKGIKLFPLEFSVHKDDSGRPYIAGANMEKIYVSLSHKNNSGVAVASDEGSIGIDMEEIKERDSDFIGMLLSPEEEKIVGNQNLSEILTRCWVAKEAYGKYLGKGLRGTPRNYTISGFENDEFTIDGKKIKTIKHLNFIIGWTI